MEAQLSLSLLSSLFFFLGLSSLGYGVFGKSVCVSIRCALIPSVFFFFAILLVTGYALG